MSRIYANAIFNFSALTARSDGIFSDRAIGVHTLSARWIFLEHSGSDVTLFIQDKSIWETYVLNMPLSRRGWPCKSNSLRNAPGGVFFGQHRVLWQCPSLRACETDPRDSEEFHFTPYGDDDPLEFLSRPEGLRRSVLLAQRGVRSSQDFVDRPICDPTQQEFEKHVIERFWGIDTDVKSFNGPLAQRLLAWDINQCLERMGAVHHSLYSVRLNEYLTNTQDKLLAISAI